MPILCCNVQKRTKQPNSIGGNVILIVEKEITLPVFEAWTNNWTPFWHGGVSPVWLYSTKELIQREQADWQREGQIVQQYLDEMTGAHHQQSPAAAAATSSPMIKRTGTMMANSSNSTCYSPNNTRTKWPIGCTLRNDWSGLKPTVNISSSRYGVCILVYYYYPNNDETESSSSSPPQWLRWVLSLAAGGIGRVVVDDDPQVILPVI
jgi:hypothetical protein